MNICEVYNKLKGKGGKFRALNTGFEYSMDCYGVVTSPVADIKCTINNLGDTHIQGWLTSNFEIIVPKVDFMTAWKHMEKGGRAKHGGLIFKIKDIYFVSDNGFTCSITTTMVNSKEWELL